MLLLDNQSLSCSCPFCRNGSNGCSRSCVDSHSLETDTALKDLRFFIVVVVGDVDVEDGEVDEGDDLEDDIVVGDGLFLDCMLSCVVDVVGVAGVVIVDTIVVVVVVVGL